MTQLELPTISVERYVDLLKRRRWQVVPVSLLGLVVGGVVAFFIPRYFVASAVLVYMEPPGEASARNEDPYAAIVASAKLTIPLAIGPTIKALKWPEAATTDPHELAENIAAIDERLDVVDANAGEDRKFVRLDVIYRDRDGMRAAAFTNALVETWRDQRIEEERARAEADKQAATEQQRQQAQAFDACLRTKQELEETHGLAPDLDPMSQRAWQQQQHAAAQAAADRLTEKRGALARLEEHLRQLQKQLEETPPRVPPDAASATPDTNAAPGAKELLAAILYYTQLRDGIRADGPLRARRASYEATIAALKEALAQLPGGVAVGEDGMVPNPAHRELAAKIAGADGERQQKLAEIAPLQQQVERDQQRAARLPEAHVAYEHATQALAQTKTKLDAALLRLEDARQRLGRLGTKPPVEIQKRADPPPRPTEPNILLVALLGCIVGLLVATAGILLLDILRGSFKTVDEVERGLPVPVLGALSHLETDEERHALVRSRRRMTLTAAAFVFLVSSVVLVFYYDPTRLPPFVRDLLALVLGAS